MVPGPPEASFEMRSAITPQEEGWASTQPEETESEYDETGPDLRLINPNEV